MWVAIADTLKNGIDAEWLALILEAKEVGITKETILNFLHQKEAREVV
jgi:hypothetical protein